MAIPPHQRPSAPITIRRGQFWIPGRRTELPHGTVARGPMFVSWEAPETATKSPPLVLIHGGGGQGTNWTATPDGRPGWATRLVEAGFPVYVVDRCGHGRSPYHPDVIGPMGAQIPYQAVAGLFFPEERRAAQTQWTYSREGGEVDQMIAAMGPLPADLAESQRMDADALAQLLDITGPAVLVTHSAGGPVGWLATDARPDKVRAIAAIEPVGPPFAELPGMGTLDWGLTSAPIGFAAGWDDPGAVRDAPSQQRVIPALADKPIAVVTGGASPFADFAPSIVEFLCTAGAAASQLHLPDHGVDGNGHGLIFEANSDDTVVPVIDWIRANIH